MRQLITLLLLFASFTVIAHDGLFIKPTIGATIGGFSAKSENFFKYSPDLYWEYNSGRGYLGGLHVGYDYKKWTFGIGGIYLSQQSTGRHHFLNMRGGVLVDTTNATEAINFQYFLGPITVSYRCSMLGGKVYVTPSVGVDVSYNISRVADINVPDSSGYPLSRAVNGVIHYELKGDDFTKRYHKLSVWATGGVAIEVPINNKNAISLGATCHYVVSKFAKESGQGDKFYFLALDLGYKFSFSRSNKTKGLNTTKNELPTSTSP